MIQFEEIKEWFKAHDDIYPYCAKERAEELIRMVEELKARVEHENGLYLKLLAVRTFGFDVDAHRKQMDKRFSELFGGAPSLDRKQVLERTKATLTDYEIALSTIEELKKEVKGDS